MTPEAHDSSFLSFCRPRRGRALRWWRRHHVHYCLTNEVQAANICKNEECKVQKMQVQCCGVAGAMSILQRSFRVTIPCGGGGPPVAVSIRSWGLPDFHQRQRCVWLTRRRLIKVIIRQPRRLMRVPVRGESNHSRPLAMYPRSWGPSRECLVRPDSAGQAPASP